jgi:hypothetical protein
MGKSGQQFERADGAQITAANLDASLALHEATYGDPLLIEVGQKKKPGADVAPADPLDPKSDGPRTKAEKLLADAMATFVQGDDPNKAMKSAEPEFKAAIKQADTDADIVIANAKKEAEKIGPAYQKAVENEHTADQNLREKFSHVPESEQPKVQALLQAWASVDPKDPVRAAVEKDLAKYPGLMDAAKASERAQNDPTLKRGQELESSVQTAIEDRALTRVAYARALETCGRTDDAYEQVKQAAEILGLPAPPRPRSNQITA